MAPQVYSSLLMSFQTISPGPRLAIPFRDMVPSKLKDHHFSVARECAFSIIRSYNVHLQSITSIRSLRTCLAVVTGKNSVSASPKTQCFSSTKNRYLIAYKEIGTVHSTKHEKCITTFIVWTKCTVRDFKAGALRSNFKWFTQLLFQQNALVF
jgi:hypothetical protein